MRKRRLSKALAMFLAAALTIPAAVPVVASESTADKEETVYVKTDANGEEKTVIVSDWLKNFSGEAKIKDATDLTDVEDVKGNETNEAKRTVLHGMPMEKIFTIREQVTKICQYP